MKKLDYPIDKKTGEFYAGMPTRLGNLLYALRDLHEYRHKLDLIFYWSRLWLVLDKDLRGAIDETQAMADSAVYVCFACYASFVLVIYSLGGFLARAISLFPLQPSVPSIPVADASSEPASAGDNRRRRLLSHRYLGAARLRRNV